MTQLQLTLSRPPVEDGEQLPCCVKMTIDQQLGTKTGAVNIIRKYLDMQMELDKILEEFDVSERFLEIWPLLRKQTCRERDQWLSILHNRFDAKDIPPSNYVLMKQINSHQAQFIEKITFDVRVSLEHLKIPGYPSVNVKVLDPNWELIESLQVLPTEKMGYRPVTLQPQNQQYENLKLYGACVQSGRLVKEAAKTVWNTTTDPPQYHN